VGDSGFEPLASSASRKRSPPELIARTKDLFFASLPRGGTRNRTGVQGFADPCLTTRPCRQHLGTAYPSAFRPGVRAEDGIRTRDPHHGKVMLYQLSYFRVARAWHVRCQFSMLGYILQATQEPMQVIVTIPDLRLQLARTPGYLPSHQGPWYGSRGS
jgi:hypothetical protein